MLRDIETCPECKVRVLVSYDGRCPSCGKQIHAPVTPPPQAPRPQEDHKVAPEKTTVPDREPFFSRSWVVFLGITLALTVLGTAVGFAARNPLCIIAPPLWGSGAIAGGAFIALGVWDSLLRGSLDGEPRQWIDMGVSGATFLMSAAAVVSMLTMVYSLAIIVGLASSPGP